MSHERKIMLNFTGVPFILTVRALVGGKEQLRPGQYPSAHIPRCDKNNSCFASRAWLADDQRAPRPPPPLPPQVSPTQEFYDSQLTTRPRDITIGAVVLTVVVAVFVLALDAISGRHLKAVVIAAVRQHEAKTESIWRVMSNLAYSSTIASQVADPAWAIVGGLDVLRSTDLSEPQQRVVVRRQRTEVTLNCLCSRTAPLRPRFAPQRVHHGVHGLLPDPAQPQPQPQARVR